LRVLGALLALGCLGGQGPEPPPGGGFDPNAEVTALFIGNSLTYTNDLPALTGQIAEAAGRSFDYAVRAAPNLSLEDHWYEGAAGLIAQLGADVVILQQGPSSLPESQQHLRTWAMQFDESIRKAGGTPALLMVWPESSRQEAFDAVSDSYRAAAEAVNGRLIPAGDAWRAVWRRDPEVALYGPDGFHPSALGSLVAALAVYAVLFDADVTTLPASVAPGVSGERLEILLAAVAEVVAPASAAASSR